MPYKDPQDQKDYYQRNKDKLIARSALNYKENREDRIKKQREYYQKFRHLRVTGEGKGHGKGKKFEKGFTPWNKGKRGCQVAWNKGMGEHRTEEGKLKFIKAMKGRVPWNRGKKSLVRGEKHHSWKGGITPINDAIRKSLDYKLWKRACLERDNFTCQISGKYGGELVVHHINNFADFPELRTAITNGITMTTKIHKAFHKKYGARNNTREQLEEFVNDYFTHT